MTFKRTFLFALLVLSLSFFTGCLDSKKDSQSSQSQKMPPTPVKVYEVKSENVPLNIIYTGKTKSVGDVGIHARVQGVLLKKNYTEGEVVKKGQSLYLIDPSTYRAEYESARATLEVEEAKFENAKKEWERVERLYSENAISQRERDSAESNYKASLASVKNARAALQNAKINLDYTKVISPVEGIAGQKMQDLGSLVGPGSNSQLTTITQLDPIYVEFAIPNDDVDMINEKGAKDRYVLPEDGKIKVDLKDTTGNVLLKDGVVDFKAVSLDEETGSVNARAVFKNEDGAIYPNRFGKVQVKDIALKDAIAIPQKAILQSPQGIFAYVYKDGSAEIRPVVLGATTSDGKFIIQKGIKEGDKVIVSNILKVKPKAPVKIVPSTTDSKEAKHAEDKEK
ncbi:MAG: efflux RND transporter periplasmic adaptor subunit [Campylobacterales bacterium]